MRWVIELSRTNFERDTGGPFGAAVFEEDTGRVVSIGVNRVVKGRCSSAHAEVMALSLAQRALGVHDLGGPGLPAHQIVVNWCPCAMCCGAICWSGVRGVVIAGSGSEMEALTGFDEGPIHPEWPEELRRRVHRRSRDGLLRDESIDAFRAVRGERPARLQRPQGLSGPPDFERLEAQVLDHLHTRWARRR